MSSEEQARPSHVLGQEPLKAGSNVSPPHCVELTPGSPNEVAQKTGCPVVRGGRPVDPVDGGGAGGQGAGGGHRSTKSREENEGKLWSRGGEREAKYLFVRR